MANRPDSELIVITKTRDLITCVFTISENAPKQYRFTLVTQMQNTALDILKNLILANESSLNGDIKEYTVRRKYQQLAIANLKVLDAFAMTALERKCILPKQYENLTRLIADCIRLTGAWINSDKKRIQR